MIQVVEQGTAKDMKINGITIAGKTGTAELKASKEEIHIGLVGKYVQLHDAYLSVSEALKSAGYYYLKKVIALTIVPFWDHLLDFT